TQLYLLDAQGDLVTAGEAGELVIGGDGLAHGYHQRPELTAERFVPDPFSGVPGARLYRTGDLAQWQRDGAIVFGGRIDQQIKLRGFRIELGEIEAALRAHEAVRDAVVLARADRPGDRQLVAYVVREQTNKGTKEQRNTDTEQDSPPSPVATGEGGRGDEGLIPGLRTYLAARLPAYMVPSAFVMLDALPLTPNGKVDRKALPAPDWSTQAQAADFVAPRTPTEELIAEVWAAVLGVGPISVETSFLALGGHSLLATQVVTRLREQTGRDLPLRLLFEAPTIAALAAALSDHQATETLPLSIVPRDGRPLPLSFAQQRLWFLDQFQPGSIAHNLPLAIRLRGSLDRAALERSLNTIIARHEVLRTTFDEQAAQPLQIIAPNAELSLPLIAVPHLPGTAPQDLVSALISAELTQPFDLRRGPLLRAKLFQVAPDDHTLALVIHHSIFDGWSESILLRELSALYAAFAAGASSPLPPLPIQYADYAVWQREWLQSAVRDQQLRYWQQQLRGVPTLDLPTDRPRPSIWTGHGATMVVHLPAALSDDLSRLSQQLDSTLFMTLLAAFQTLLYRYTRQDDIAIGTPIAGRVRPELEPLIGFFVNMLVMRTDLSGRVPSGCSFAELVTRVRATALDAYAHQDLPFEMLVEAVQPERDLSRHPLFQVMFVLQNMPTTALDLPGLTATTLPVDLPSAQFDLALTLSETDDGLRGIVEYSTDLFDAATIQRLVAQYEVLLMALVADPQQPIDRLPLLPETEQQTLLIDWNATSADYPVVGGVHDLVAAQAGINPNAIAVVDAEHSLTYAVLNARANKLAHYLRVQGIGADSARESRVGIAMEPSVEMVVGLLAILKAGAAYVPLDPNYPVDRLQFMLEDSQLEMILTQQRLVKKLPPTEQPVLCLDRDWSQVAAFSSDNPAVAVHSDQLAYMIYTSGSTGTPKGVLVPHRGVINNLAWRQASWPLTAADRSLLNFSISFDPAAWSIFWPLSTGARVVLVGADVRYDTAALVRTMAEQRITLFGASPSQHAVLLEEPGIAACTSLRYVVSGGEALTAELQQRFFSRLNAILCNCYGPTENTIDTTFWVCLPEDASQAAPIGRPLPNVQVYVLDPQLQPTPIGVAGELYVSGVQLARGYHQRPDLTALRFVPNPFAEDGSRLYKTGDLVRYRADSVIEFLGRIDQQVKLRGFRIELGEIEALLQQHPAVRDAAVIVREDHPGDQRLVAYVVENLEPRTQNLEEEQRAQNKEQPNATIPPRLRQPRRKPGEVRGRGLGGEGLPLILRRYLQERLPGYMVPSAFVLLDALPLTPNSKLDRKALPAPELNRADADTAVLPRTPLEEQIAEVWSEVLQIERPSIHDNFFALGGHSLLATQVTSRVRQLTGQEIPLRLLFEAPTIGEFAARLGDQHATEMLPLVAVPRDGGPLPLSYAQQRLWFLDQLQPGQTTYHLPLLLHLHGPLDRTALVQSLSAIVARHEVLRTTFAPAATPDAPPVQVIAPPAPVALPCQIVTLAP
ncbi:MAG: amino acid adenylation domain-containing protein, partial [Chloroflexi bacterium]|nr:amino acid adenylation domain-containing protein [Chloroflexota bacterium]